MFSRRWRMFLTLTRPFSYKSQKEIQFVDWRRVNVKSGDGADGCVHFRRQKFEPRGGPDGGNGGSGGSVVVIADRRYRDLSHVKVHYKAKHGGKGAGEESDGKNAEAVVIQVPPGTVIKDKETNELIADLDFENNQVTVAQGGKGGIGNAAFRTATNKAPKEGTPGTLGEERVIYLELKTIADVGLVGFPNAGKSTLLRALSKAKPAVAAYPFTTLNPHVGVMQYDDFVEIAVADIPGLVEGAHLNKGLGHSFLRHIERCNCLLYVIDICQPDPVHHLCTLQTELELYRQGLSRLPSAIVANKIDILDDKDLAKGLRSLREEIKLPVISISAKEKMNIDKLKTHIRQIFDKALRQSFVMLD